ncbi:hypothetical protein KDW_26850 [Dictyobacter vulcani]|uniref:3-keto-disaccharide hydrolase domain-containing protein n=1 Tax=Dictyobacter vulcani TaxID=2607529 RepID=A0A5J4KL66_9CHLR|nr:hypothetical protein KDW_26850 [Dictyobacter vulcani]
MLIAAIIMLTLLLAISGASLMYYAGVIHPARMHTQATATALVRQITNHHATATAAVHNNSTAIAGKKTASKATAIAHAQATTYARASDSSQQKLYVQSTRGKPTFSSPLFFDTGDNWDIYPTKDGGGCTFTDNALHSSVFQDSYYAPCIAHDLHVQNFALEIQMTILKGEEGGVIFRSNANDKNFYSFRLRCDGTYGLILTRDDGHTTPLVYDKNTLIKNGNGKTNIVTIIARANIIYLYINKHYVGSASDNTYRAGSIGVLAVDRQKGTDVAFNNLRLWKL